MRFCERVSRQTEWWLDNVVSQQSFPSLSFFLPREGIMNPWWMHGSVLQFQCTVGSSRTVNKFCGQNAQSRCEHTRTGSTQTSWVVSSSLGARDFIDRETVLPGNVHRCLSVQMSQGLQDDSSLGPAISMWISENLVPPHFSCKQPDLQNVVALFTA